MRVLNLDGDYIYAGHYAEEKQIEVIKRDDFEIVEAYNVPSFPNALLVTEDGRFLLVADSSGSLTIFKIVGDKLESFASKKILT